VAEELDDEFFGVDSHGMRRGSYALLCHCVMTAGTLEHAISRTLRFLNLVLDDFHATLFRSGEQAEIRIHDRGSTQT
jgi:hypothetical protein